MIIELATSNFDIDNESRDFDHKISTDELYETHNRAWKEGIYVDDEQWQTLKKTAAAILVENSDTSSKGAGGGSVLNAPGVVAPDQRIYDECDPEGNLYGDGIPDA